MNFKENDTFCKNKDCNYICTGILKDYCCKNCKNNKDHDLSCLKIQESKKNLNKIEISKNCYNIVHMNTK